MVLGCDGPVVRVQSAGAARPIREEKEFLSDGPADADKVKTKNRSLYRRFAACRFAYKALSLTTCLDNRRHCPQPVGRGAAQLAAGNNRQAQAAAASKAVAAVAPTKARSLGAGECGGRLSKCWLCEQAAMSVLCARLVPTVLKLAEGWRGRGKRTPIH